MLLSLGLDRWLGTELPSPGDASPSEASWERVSSGGWERVSSAASSGSSSPRPSSRGQTPVRAPFPASGIRVYEEEEEELELVGEDPPEFLLPQPVVRLLFMLGSLACIGWALYFISSIWLLGFLEESARLGESALELSPGFRELSKMPAQWDRRYYRVSELHGMEVMLVRRGGAAGQWLVVKPDRSLARLDLNHRPTVGTQPTAGVQYLAMPVLTALQRQELVAAAERVAAGEVPAPALVRYGGPRRGLHRWVGALALLPWRGAQWARWCLRSRWRFAGLVANGAMLGDLLNRVGFFEWCRQAYVRAREFYGMVRTAAEETSAWYNWFFELAESIHGTISALGDPATILLYVAGLVIVTWAFSGAAEEPASPSSTAAPSEASTPPESPRTAVETSLAAQTAAITELLSQQTQAIAGIRSGQEELRQQMEEGELREQSRVLQQGSGVQREADREEIRQLGRRIEAFQAQVEARMGALAGPATTPNSAAMASAGNSTPPGLPPAQPPLPPPVTGPGDPGSKVGELIRRLEKRSELPQARFLEILQEYAEVGKEWEEAFPAGYRTRVAP